MLSHVKGYFLPGCDASVKAAFQFVFFFRHIARHSSPQDGYILVDEGNKKFERFLSFFLLVHWSIFFVSRYLKVWCLKVNEKKRLKKNCYSPKKH